MDSRSLKRKRRNKKEEKKMGKDWRIKRENESKAVKVWQEWDRNARKKTDFYRAAGNADAVYR